jgi:hypothetical protein
MDTAGSERPQVLVPYPGPQISADTQDIFVYLRPETNGVLVESTLLKVIEQCPEYRTGIRLVYLANIPGSYIVAHHVIEAHYAHKFFFAVHGQRFFTPRMREAFEKTFAVPVDRAHVVGSFEALRILKMRPEELFRLWVPPERMLIVDAQSIKQIDGLYVVNYDIPALLHKNTRNTDIAVMLFRCNVEYEYFVELVHQMEERLVTNELLDPRAHPSRAFHYSKGPFEQVLDGLSYLLTPSGQNVDLSALSFVAYAAANGLSPREIVGLVKNPIVMLEDESGSRTEENIYSLTSIDSYPEALEKVRRVVAQLWIRQH